MPLNVKMQKKKVVGKLRRAQLITTFGTGSIVDMPDYSVIMASTKYWNDQSPILHEENLERLLHVSSFRTPYAADGHGESAMPDIPALRFPTMHFCSGCGRLMPYWGFGKDDEKACGYCGKKVIPSRFVAACINGHMEDFPYSWWVHKGDFRKCPYNKKRDNLRITFTDTTGGLDSILITCTDCEASRTMAGCMSPDALRGYRCQGLRPWYYRDDSEYHENNDCAAPMRALQRGASNVYFSVTSSALTIPPASRKVNQAIDAKWSDGLRALMMGNPDDSTVRTILRYEFQKDLVDTGLATIDEILQIVKKRSMTEQLDEEYTLQNLLEDEYRVFCIGDYQDPDDRQFRTSRVAIPSGLEDYIEDVILAKRLRVVMALRGFTRITPENPDPNNPKFEGSYDREYIPLADPEPDWLPGIEMLGEGIFIRLKDEVVQQWESLNQREYDAMHQRLRTSTVRCDQFSSRYVLLHTLAHLLIRQLTVECGYSGASIQERIYSTFPDSDRQMCGILLYTSTSDSDGSLGGLVRQGEPDSMENIFRNMFQEASWCSSDPVCIGSRAQGYDSLNYAACHACTLLPETSCEMRNCLLDRASVVGEIGKDGRGYFESLVREGWK